MPTAPLARPAPALTLDPSVAEPEAVAGELGTDLDRGLEREEAARRLAASGPNQLRQTPPVPAWRRLLGHFRDPLIYLLLAAVAVSLAAWVVEGAHGWPFDAIVILLIVIANAVLGFVQESRAENAVAALQRMSAVTATVVRDGEQVRVPASEVVTGDILVLAEGDAVAADARLVAAAALKASEASLTGESEPVHKTTATLTGPAALADRVDMVFTGTAITQGAGRAVVTATGMDTEMGRIADLLHETEDDPTPLQREIAAVGRMLGIAVIVIAVVVMATVFLTAGVDTAEEAVTVLLLGVSLAVAAVPEGLPAILSVVLAIGVQRLAAHRAIVKQLSSVETLGSASVICSDKTGTLTRNEMTVERVVTASGETVLTGIGYHPEGTVLHDGAPLTDDALRHENVLVLSGGSLASDAVLTRDGDEWTIQGDPTEAAFLVAELKLGTAALRQERFHRVGEVPFTSERKLMSSLEADAERGGRVTVLTKGAPDVLLGRCTHVQVGRDVVALDAAHRTRVLGDVERLSGQALRTLGVAYRELDGTAPPSAEEDVERDLVFAGIVGIIDPPRSEAAAAIRQARGAGVRIGMITGDHPVTAGRIAADLGILDEGSRVLSGPDLESMDEQELVEAARRTSVYARVSPHHKLRIVDALQADGNVVAMTGDGVNDAPALKSADIGVAMGVTGTEVTKEAADMILADDNFTTIVEAVRQGRDIFDNIRKFLRYLLSSNMGEVLTVFLGVVLAGAIGLTDTGTGGALVLPLLATQILWINLLTDTGPALAMGVDPETDDVMARPPRPMSARVIDARMWWGVLSTGLVMALATLFTLDLYLPGGLVEGDRSLDVARTAAFTVLVFAQLYNAVNARSETTTAFHRLFVNPWLWTAIGVSLALQVAVVHLPLLNEAFSTAPLDLGQWLTCAAVASVVLWAVELRKLVERAVDRRAGRVARS
ncbi:MAG: cation-translocating P-type ATPase [Actinomycetales bacterium]|nr:cation-translocating P-type ATPase [Actinomycetales bacterium]